MATDLPQYPAQEPVQEQAPLQTVQRISAQPQVVDMAAPQKKNSKAYPFLLALLGIALVALLVMLYLRYNPSQSAGNVTPTPTPKATTAVTKTPAVTGTVPATAVATPTATPNPAATMTLKFYMSDSKLDPNVENCNAPSFVTRDLPKTTTPLADALTYQIHTLKLTAAEKTAGLVNQFENATEQDKLTGFNLKSASVVNGMANLTFEDTKFYTIGGSCRTSIIKEQLTGTAKQFPTVKNVRFLPLDILFQP